MKNKYNFYFEKLVLFISQANVPFGNIRLKKVKLKISFNQNNKIISFEIEFLVLIKVIYRI